MVKQLLILSLIKGMIASLYILIFIGKLIREDKNIKISFYIMILISIILYYFIDTLMYSASTLSDFYLWSKISFSILSFIILFIFLFSTRTFKISLGKTVYGLLFISTFILIYFNLFSFSLFKKITIINNHLYSFELNGSSIFTYLFFSYCFLMILNSSLMIITKPVINKHYQKKYRFQIIAVSIFLLVINIFDYTIFPYIFTDYKVINVIGMSLSFWFLYIWYILKKYQFIDFTLHDVVYDIINNIDEYIIFFDYNFRITQINHKIIQLFCTTKKEIISQDFLYFIKSDKEKEKIKNFVKDNNVTEIQFNIEIEYQNIEILVSMYLKKVRDKFKDLIGILAIGSLLKTLDHIKSEFKITNKEFLILNLIRKGLTNVKIAELLSLSESTIKSHVSRIYKKLKVQNKTKLQDKLGDIGIDLNNSNN